MTTKISEDKIIEALKEVYDPEFPIVDIYTLWLIYNIDVQEGKIFLLITLTSPACPMADMIVDNIKTAISDIYPEAEVDVEITFEPMWSPDSIKDEDLKRMFDVW